MKIISICAAIVLILTAASGTAAPPTNSELQQQVGDTERAFAAAMKTRDLAAFESFISDEAIFSGGAQPLRGKEAIAAEWKRFFVKPDAPFTWTPDRVEVLGSCKNFCVNRGHEIIPKGMFHDRHDDHQETPQEERAVSIPS